MSSEKQDQEEERLLFLLEKKKDQLKEIKMQEKVLLSQIISYRDQLQKIRDDKKKKAWVEEEKKRSARDRKREAILIAIEKRQVSCKS